MNRRNFAKFAGASIAGMMAGCSSGSQGNQNNSKENQNNSEKNSTSNNNGGLQKGERPFQWIGIPPYTQKKQNQKYQSLTGIESKRVATDTNTVVQKSIQGSSIDAVVIDASQKPILAANDRIAPIPASSLDGWNKNNIADLYWKPKERLSHLGKQADYLYNIMYTGQPTKSPDSEEDLYHPPLVQDLDAIAYNPKYVQGINKWESIFDPQYQGKTLFDGIATIGMVELIQHLMAKDIIDKNIDRVSYPTKDMIDKAVNWITKKKKNGQFRAVWTSSGNSVNLMASEEAIIADIWQPSLFDVRRSGTPMRYADMAGNFNGYRFWYAGVSPIKPSAKNRNNMDEARALQEIHYMAWFPGFIQQGGYGTAQWSNKALVRMGEDESGKGMGAEYYDWAHEGKATYESIDDPDMFDPKSYDWSWKEGSPDPNGAKRDGGSTENRIDKISAYQFAPPNASYLLDKWNDFTSA